MKKEMSACSAHVMAPDGKGRDAETGDLELLSPPLYLANNFTG